MQKTKYFSKLALLAALAIGLFFSYATNNRLHAEDIDSFDKAKPILFKIHQEHPITIYLGCKYDTDTRKIIAENCLYDGDYETVFVNWEHVVPVGRFVKYFNCGSRNNCQKTSPEFKKTEGDMHNLEPSISAINSLRADYDIGVVTDKNALIYGSFKLSKAQRLAEPSDQSKGLVARIYQYMAQRGYIALTPAENELFSKWSRLYPPDAWECKKNELVKSYQGIDNLFVSTNCYSK